MNNPKTIIINPYTFKVKEDRIVFTGVRGSEKNLGDKQRYKVHILLKDDWLFSYLAKSLKKQLTDKIAKINSLINEI